MKKLSSAAVSVFCALCLLLPSCGEKETEAPVQDRTEEPAVSAQTDAGSEAAAGWTMRLDNGTEIPLGAVADDTLAALGDPTDLMEAPSCVREGVDRVYTYGASFTLTTAPDENGADRITEVTLLSDAVAISENGVFVMIGSNVSDADTAFGTPAESTDTVRCYPIPGGTLTVTAADGEITGITAAYEG